MVIITDTIIIIIIIIIHSFIHSFIHYDLYVGYLQLHTWQKTVFQGI
jgi:hypothetical protein